MTHQGSRLLTWVLTTIELMCFLEDILKVIRFLTFLFWHKLLPPVRICHLPRKRHPAESAVTCEVNRPQVNRRTQNCHQSLKTSGFSGFFSVFQDLRFQHALQFQAGFRVHEHTFLRLEDVGAWNHHWKHHVFLYSLKDTVDTMATQQRGFTGFTKLRWVKPARASSKILPKIEIKLGYKWSCCFLVEALPFFPSGGYTRHLLWVGFGLPGDEKSFESAQQKKNLNGDWHVTSIWLNNGSSPSSVVMNKFHVKFYWSIRKRNPAPSLYTQCQYLKPGCPQNPSKTGLFPG